MNDPIHEVDEVEKTTKFTIIRLADDTDDEKSSIIENSIKELRCKCEECRKWIHNNTNSSETSMKIENLKNDTKKLLSSTKYKLKVFQSNEEVTEAKEKFIETKDKVFSIVDNGIDEILKNEYVSKTIDTISDSIEIIRNDERVKTNVKKLKKGTLKIAEKAYKKLQQVLDTEDEE